MLGYLFKAFKRERCDTFAKWRNLKSERLSCTSVRKGMPPKEIHEGVMKTLDWGLLLIAQ